MPRIRVSQPSSELIRSHPREYALFKQMANGKGNIEPEVFNQYVKQYASTTAHTASSTEDLSFEQFVKLFKAQPTAASGEGNCVGFAAHDTSGFVTPIKFTRRATRPHDIQIKIAYSGICHSDVHTVKNEWKNAVYPLIAGHEITGIITEVGSAVKGFKVGDRAGVGCLVNSCQSCDQCLKKKEENYCPGKIFTYNSKDVDGTQTYGGYATSVTVNQKFVLRIPASLPLDLAAPLLCAGVTTYSPLRHFKLDKKGMKVGVLGLGGLGHMAVKFAKALGVEVTVISSSAGKQEEALKVLKADHFLIASDTAAMKAAAQSLDGIINTVSAKLDLSLYLALIKNEGTMVCLGVPEDPPSLPLYDMVYRRVAITGSLIGGIKETQEMLDFAAKHNVTPLIEKIPMDYVNTAYERILKSDVRYRFVIDIQGSLIL